MTTWENGEYKESPTGDFFQYLAQVEEFNSRIDEVMRNEDTDEVIKILTQEVPCLDINFFEEAVYKNPELKSTLGSLAIADNANILTSVDILRSGLDTNNVSKTEIRIGKIFSEWPRFYKYIISLKNALNKNK